jgi:hypothetical protein
VGFTVKAADVSDAVGVCLFQVIFSMADEYVPEHVDKINLIKR